MGNARRSFSVARRGFTTNPIRFSESLSRAPITGRSGFVRKHKETSEFLQFTAKDENPRLLRLSRRAIGKSLGTFHATTVPRAGTPWKTSRHAKFHGIRTRAPNGINKRDGEIPVRVQNARHKREMFGKPYLQFFSCYEAFGRHTLQAQPGEFRARSSARDEFTFRGYRVASATRQSRPAGRILITSGKTNAKFTDSDCTVTGERPKFQN